VAVLLRQIGRAELARSYYRDIINGYDIFNFAVGKTTPWADEESPELPIDSDLYVNNFKNETLFLQKINPADICLLARRIDWTSGTVYDTYDINYSPSSLSYSGASTLHEANFYVMTDEYKVYKCLGNNYNSPSTIKPNSISSSVHETSDGYVWKFLFQIASSDRTRFLDAEHIPVRKLTGAPEFDVNGELDTITVTAPGSGYTSAPAAVITGDGIGATAEVTVVAGEVTAITITNAGSGYTFAFISLVGGGGTGATASISLGDVDALPSLQTNVEGSAVSGTLDRIDIVTTGQDYIAGDAKCVVEGDGSGAECTIFVAPGTGAILGVEITNPGSGYTWVSVTIVNTDPAATGTGATARGVISPQGGHGSHPPKELFATTLGITISLADNSNEDLIKGNDFRQVGLIKNVQNYLNSNIYNNLTGTASFIVNVALADASKYVEDDIIQTNDNGRFRVITSVANSDGLTLDVYLQGIVPYITVASILENTTQGETGMTINSITDPEVNMKTGTLVYIENRPAITRSSDQVETIKAIINF